MNLVLTGRNGMDIGTTNVFQDLKQSSKRNVKIMKTQIVTQNTKRNVTPLRSRIVPWFQKRIMNGNAKRLMSKFVI